MMFTDILPQLADGLLSVMNMGSLFFMFAGVAIGIVVGALPGLSPSVGVALLLPFSFTIGPLNALLLLCGVYSASNYGGSITAIALNTPGTASAAVTAMDGYQLTRQGKPGLALGTSLYASTIGGIFGTLALILFSIPLAKLALRFESYEFFALGIFGLTIVSSLAGKSVWKGFIAAFIGLLLTTVGFDSQLPFTRFTFGLEQLKDGIPYIPALIGLFALGEIFHSAGEALDPVNKEESVCGRYPGFGQLMRLWKVILKSSVIGTLIGCAPGTGSSVASYIAYNEAKRGSKDPEKFGNGSLEGVAAPESADNASVGGALVPLLTLGIPGSASTAVLLGAFMVHHISPGPGLFKPVESGGRPDLVYGMFAGLLIINLLMFALGRMGNPLWIRVIKAPKSLIFPLVMALCFIGGYVVQSSFFDVVVVFGFGLLGWALRRAQVPVAPVVLGLVLGRMIEDNLRLSLVKGDAIIFLQRPFTVLLLVMAIISLVMPLLRNRRSKMIQQSIKGKQ